MGYYLHITRSDHWPDGSEKIAPEEWMRVAEAEPDVELWPGEEDVYTIKGCEVRPALHYNEATGDIWVRAGYFEEVLNKLIEIAAKLGAVVQGDEGEYYLLTQKGRETTWDRPDPSRMRP